MNNKKLSMYGFLYELYLWKLYNIYIIYIDKKDMLSSSTYHYMYE